MSVTRNDWENLLKALIRIAKFAVAILNKVLRGEDIT
jgi:hypothetical protein